MSSSDVETGVPDRLQQLDLGVAKAQSGRGNSKGTQQAANRQRHKASNQPKWARRRWGEPQPPALSPRALFSTALEVPWPKLLLLWSRSLLQSTPRMLYRCLAGYFHTSASFHARQRLWPVSRLANAFRFPISDLPRAFKPSTPASQTRAQQPLPFTSRRQRPVGRCTCASDIFFHRPHTARPLWLNLFVECPHFAHEPHQLRASLPT